MCSALSGLRSDAGRTGDASRIAKLMKLRRTVSIGFLGATTGASLMMAALFRPDRPRPFIAFIARTSGTNLTEDMRRGAEAAAEKAGYGIYWNAPTRADDVDRQLRIAEKAVESGAKAVILGPTNPWGVTTLIDRLHRRKIPVVIVQTESPVPTGAYLTSVTPDQEKIGKLGADRVVTITGDAGKVAIVGIDRGEPETLARAQAFVQQIATHPGIEVVAQASGSVQAQEAEQSVKAILNSYPDVKALFAVSADATQGALLALQDMKADGKIALIGCDRDMFLMDSLRAGKLDSLIGADGYQVGNLAAHAALDEISGQFSEPDTHVAVTILTRESAQAH